MVLFNGNEAQGEFAIETAAGKSVQQGKNAIYFSGYFFFAMLALSVSFCPEVNTQGKFRNCSPNCNQIILVVPNEADLISLVTLSYLREQNSLQWEEITEMGKE